MENKRGISDVVTTTLLVLITLAAAALITSFIVPFVKDGLASSSECLNYREALKFDSSLGYNCYDSENLHGVTVRTSNIQGAENLLSFKLVFKDSTESKTVDVVNGSAIVQGGIKLLDRSKAYVSVPLNGEAYTYVYEANKQYKQVEVYPVANSGKICEKTDTLELKFCKETDLTPNG